MKNLEERQKRVIEALQMELATCINDQEDVDRLLDALEQVKSDPETYFKNIDEEE